MSSKALHQFPIRNQKGRTFRNPNPSPQHSDCAASARLWVVLPSLNFRVAAQEAPYRSPQLPRTYTVHDEQDRAGRSRPELLVHLCDCLLCRAGSHINSVAVKLNLRGGNRVSSVGVCTPSKPHVANRRRSVVCLRVTAAWCIV
jgi:hypothetical protein